MAFENIFKAVATYQPGELGVLRNTCPMLATANKKFKDFQNLTGNLGTSVTFDLPPKSIARDSLKVEFTASEQLFETLTVDTEVSTARQITPDQLIYNDMDNYMKTFGRSDMLTLGTKIERNFAAGCVSAFVNKAGSKNSLSGPFRFFGDGSTPINSYQQLAQNIANWKALGSSEELKVYLPNTVVPAIIGTGLNQFAPERNNKIAMSWEIGTFQNVTYYSSTCLPIHDAGNVGNDGDVLTVTATSDPTGAAITTITFSGATGSGGTDPSAIKAGDLVEFTRASGLRALQYYGNGATNQLVQFRATANAASSGGNVTITVLPTLVATSGSLNQNININIVAGMTARVLPSHQAGLLVDSNAMFLAMPKMPDASPYASASSIDPQTGISLRSYHGMTPFDPTYGYVHDGIYGAHIVPRWSQRLIFPLSQGI